MNAPPSVLVIGYGNPGRRDDGLGPALAERIADLALPGVTVETPYQLQIEDSATIAAYDLVVFADADAAEAAGGDDAAFTCRPVTPEPGPVWTSHALTPGAVLALAGDVYGVRPPAVIVGVRGYEFDAFEESLSPGARRNVDAATAWLAPRLRDGGRRLRDGVAAGTIGV